MGQGKLRHSSTNRPILTNKDIQELVIGIKREQKTHQNHSGEKVPPVQNRPSLNTANAEKRQLIADVDGI